MKMDRNLIYGELTYKGLTKLFKNLEENNQINSNSTFVDIGSGYGKIVRWVAEMYNIPCYGIEIDKEKHDIAKKITKWSHVREKILLMNESFVDCKDIIKESTIVFTNNVMFDLALNKELWQSLHDNCIFLHNSPSLKIFSSVHNEPINLKWSWNKEKDKTSPIYKINTKDV